MRDLDVQLSRRHLATVGALVGLHACAPEQEPRQQRATPRVSASPASASSPTPAQSATPTPSSAGSTREVIVKQFQDRSPTLWSDGNHSALPGLVRRTESDSVVLTLDACGGKHGSRVDDELLNYLRSERIPAVVFLNKRWIEANAEAFNRLAEDSDLFEIGNHGTRHVPLSVTGRSQYGIAGTRNAGEVFDEIMENHTFLTGELGTPPRYFRTGTAWYDDVAVKIVRALGEVPVGFDINGDAGATFTAEQVANSVQQARAGSIILCHCNQPRGDTYEGLRIALPKLRASGLTFTTLAEAGV
ncbi:polysaccharide deacetylase family protein [uncultured Tessaracoccus sp.]|uniref:polysaccharide deacetylase family protein n=1 Tax=uncultured Tessaracoccus sp. TaxID=905023 RepID=UPI002605A41F|nr:polysaccharide deacetylase family protein [uncultured Tessaracoccus sp.]